MSANVLTARPFDYPVPNHLVGSRQIHDWDVDWSHILKSTLVTRWADMNYNDKAAAIEVRGLASKDHVF